MNIRHKAPVLSEGLVVLGIFITLSWLYYSDTFNYWFVGDDALSLLSATEPLKAIFFSHPYSAFFYTPLQALLFKPDIWLFGLNPFPYHVHNMIILVLIALMAYVMLRHHTGKAAAFLSAFIVLFSPPSTLSVIFITLRQYLYSLLFAQVVLSLYITYKPTARSRPLMLTFMLVLSELSFMCKEQFMALPLVLLVVSEGGLKKRLSDTSPFFLLLVAHFLLRWHVLGGPGGYPVHYDLAVYARTTVASLLTTSEVLFGYSWIVVLLAVPLLFTPRKILFCLLMWLGALSISFVTMSALPQVGHYRYWLIAVVLLSAALGLSLSVVKRTSLRSILAATALALFLHHSLEANRYLKQYYGEGSRAAGSVAETLLEAKYKDSVVLFPSTPNLIIDGFFISNISLAYRAISGIEPFATYYPLELLALFPEMLKDFRGSYELKGDSIESLKDSIGERTNQVRASQVKEKPEIRLFKGEATEVTLNCRPDETVIFCSVKRQGTRFYSSRDYIPCVKRFSIGHYVKKGGSVSIMPGEGLSYHNGMWYLPEGPLPDNSSFVIALYENAEGKRTLFSDVLYMTLAHF